MNLQSTTARWNVREKEKNAHSTFTTVRTVTHIPPQQL